MKILGCVLPAPSPLQRAPSAHQGPRATPRTLPAGTSAPAPGEASRRSAQPCGTAAATASGGPGPALSAAPPAAAWDPGPASGTRPLVSAPARWGERAGAREERPEGAAWGGGVGSPGLRQVEGLRGPPAAPAGARDAHPERSPGFGAGSQPPACGGHDTPQCRRGLVTGQPLMSLQATTGQVLRFVYFSCITFAMFQLNRQFLSTIPRARKIAECLVCNGSQ